MRAAAFSTFGFALEDRPGSSLVRTLRQRIAPDVRSQPRQFRSALLFRHQASLASLSRARSDFLSCSPFTRLNMYCKCRFRRDMRLTTFTDFRLRPLMRLAGESDRSSQSARSPPNSYSPQPSTKIIGGLAAASLWSTKAVRGFRLLRPAHSIPLREIIRAPYARHALVKCFREDGGNCVLTPRCRLKTKLASAR